MQVAEMVREVIRKNGASGRFQSLATPGWIGGGETGQPGAGMYGNPLFYRGNWASIIGQEQGGSLILQKTCLAPDLYHREIEYHTG